MSRGQRRETSRELICAFEVMRRRVKRSSWIPRARSTRSRTRAEGSPVPSPPSSATGSAGTSTCRSIRSRRGPEMRLR